MAPLELQHESASSTSDSQEGADQDGWEDMEPDNEEAAFTSLFENRTFHDLEELLRYDQRMHHFDLRQVLKSLGGLPRLILSTYSPRANQPS